MSYPGVNAPKGLQPYAYVNGTPWSGQMSEYSIASGYNTSLFTGDPVKTLNTGCIGIGVTSTGIVGVFMGVKFIDASGNFQNLPYWPAGQTTLGGVPATAMVVDDPNVLFNIQVSTSSNANPIVPVGVILTDIGLNGSFAVTAGGGAATPPYTVNPGAGSTRTGQSGYYLDYATPLGVGATLSLKIMRLTNDVTNGYFVNNGDGTYQYAFNHVSVLINNHILKGGTGTAGV